MKRIRKLGSSIKRLSRHGSREDAKGNENSVQEPQATGSSEKRNDETCTVNDLIDILTESTGGMVMLPDRDHDLVYPGIYIGEEGMARNTIRLPKLGITHIVNAAEGDHDRYHCNASAAYYTDVHIDFFGVVADDDNDFPLNKQFEGAADFIDKALVGGGKVFVHCREGVSRSATIVLAYLMLKQHMKVQDAARLVNKSRSIFPNAGFLQQLCDLNDRLTKEGHFTKVSEGHTASDNTKAAEDKVSESHKVSDKADTNRSGSHKAKRKHDSLETVPASNVTPNSAAIPSITIVDTDAPENNPPDAKIEHNAVKDLSLDETKPSDESTEISTADGGETQDGKTASTSNKTKDINGTADP